jgi:hypothetical protein
MQQQLDSRFAAVKAYIDQASAPAIPEQVQSSLFRFGTVLICGNIERCIEIVILSRLTNRAQPRVLNFVKSHFMRGTNSDCQAIGQLLNRFDSEWYRAFCRFVDNNPAVKEGIASCYAVRNSVAHGGAGSVGGARLRELLTVSEALITAVVEATR